MTRSPLWLRDVLQPMLDGDGELEVFCGDESFDVEGAWTRSPKPTST